MNKKEAKEIALNLFYIDDCAKNVCGRDCATQVANTAIDSMYAIIESNPKIKKEFENWKLTD